MTRSSSLLLFFARGPLSRGSRVPRGLRHSLARSLCRITTLFVSQAADLASCSQGPQTAGINHRNRVGQCVPFLTRLSENCLTHASQIKLFVCLRATRAGSPQLKSIGCCNQGRRFYVRAEVAQWFMIVCELGAGLVCRKLICLAPRAFLLPEFNTNKHLHGIIFADWPAFENMLPSMLLYLKA